MPNDHDLSINMHVWKKREDDHMVDLYTISDNQTAICFDLPLPDALNALNRHLETL
jgi:hypothetical protein